MRLERVNCKIVFHLQEETHFGDYLERQDKFLPSSSHHIDPSILCQFRGTSNELLDDSEDWPYLTFAERTSHLEHI